MFIKKISIENFKSFEDKFELELNETINIIVGNNEAGKTTILEAIHLGLTGYYNGKLVRNDLSQYLFNNHVIDNYLKKIKEKEPVELPQIRIELFLSGDDSLANFRGDNNSLRTDDYGLCFIVKFDNKYQEEYAELIETNEIYSLPIEYYEVIHVSFSRNHITARTIPFKSAFIDSSTARYQNGSDIYISRIIKDLLNTDDVVKISQSHRKMRDSFMSDASVTLINQRIQEASNISTKNIALSVDLGTKNAWENSLMTYLDDVPFHHIGKGEQCIIKTKLALSHRKTSEANILLIEEPENHLTHSKLNQLIFDITKCKLDKQVIITTHSSFVANKLGLKNLILLHNKKTLKLNTLTPETYNFFEKLPGYDTLRLILCNKVILVEGDCDELVLQKAYLKKTEKLPIEDQIDVISVGTSFLRFLEIAEKITVDVRVATDNDQNVKGIRKKYAKYLEKETKYPNIKICFDEIEDTGELVLNNKIFNYNTLEPKLLKINNNDLDIFNKIFDTQHENIDDMHRYMKNNKTECALKIFDTEQEIKFPQYILDAIE